MQSVFVEGKKTLPNSSQYSNPLYNHALGDHFFLVTLTNCDLNVYTHIPYKFYKIVTMGTHTHPKKKEGLSKLE